MVKRALIFGGNGFIGSHLSKRLVEGGEYEEVISADISPSPRLHADGVKYVHCDVRQEIPEDIAGADTVIYNFAAVHTTPGHPTHQYYETNIGGAIHVTEFARRKGIARIVFTSSISVYGPSEATKTEESRPTPESAYGWSKWLAEGIHRSWLSEDSGRRLVIVRPAVIFGPHEGGNFNRMAKLLKKGFFVYPGRRDTIKACFYVHDLIDAISFAQSQPENYVLFNGCYPEKYTIEQTVEIMKKVHFGGIRTLLLPEAVLLAAAGVLRPFSAAGLGIHPDRIRKLTRSTDIHPGWLIARGAAAPGGLESAIERWKVATEGRFD